MQESAERMTVCVNAPMVVSETIDNESIILHHGSGRYFSARGTGSVIWEGIEAGLAPVALASRLKSACGVESSQAWQAVSDFVEILKSHDLVKVGGAPGSALALEGPKLIPFESPRLDVHDDLADMLLLDPIHDVSDDGWPSVKA